jgi:hypothetical protein
MKTANFPRATLVNKNFPFTLTEKDWLISITDKGGVNLLQTKDIFNNVLFMQFQDTNNTDPMANGITDAQALEIAEFIKDAKHFKKNVWVNCHAGVCRSGAIVSLLIDLGWEFQDSSMSPMRIPNYLVFKKVSSHFDELKQSWNVSDNTLVGLYK